MFSMLSAGEDFSNFGSSACSGGFTPIAFAIAFAILDAFTMPFSNQA
ncbi:hypothetical protein B4098_1727 [Heyndrickxia coagulans]|uniref:Uncharacterized protein n=1 Tax=Heyndrickxia coagulans TaxID=1398 RepID=A0A150JWP8_HEYCO|nr:hypothetical protein B4098_1727 [Heyndrickxia coagulans]